MLRGEQVYLRARYESDVPVLQGELYDDVEGYVSADPIGWRPLPRGPGSRYDPKPPSEASAAFSIVSAHDDALAGEALLYDIDLHNRSAHIGLALLPAARGRGYGSETVRLLTGYGFDVLGLHRIQLETLVSNAAMLSAAEKVGYHQEGTLREAVWLLGQFTDTVVMGQTADQWRRQ